MHAKVASAKSALAGKANPSFSKQSITPFHSMRSPAERWFSLQGTVGNQAAQIIQAKLKVGPPNDRYEQEADRVAERVVQMPEVSPIDPSACETFNREGQGIPESVRSYFEPRFGHDLGDVRLHTDSSAAQLSRSLNARAFTAGRDIFFGAEEYAPQTVEGKRLIAHELTHVLQQGAGSSMIRRKIQFDSPTYLPENPIGRILGGKPVGYTTPTVNGASFPDNFMEAGSLVYDALRPKEARYDSKAKECAFNDFDVKVSANVVIPTKPEEGRWTMRLPGAGMKGVTGCEKKKSVPVVMTGKPSSKKAGEWIEKNEEEHLNDLKKLYEKYLKPYFDSVLSLKGKGEDDVKCQAVLLEALGKDQKDAKVVKKFLDDLTQAVKKRDDGGKHDFSSKIDAKNNCSEIEIKSSTK